MNLYFVVTNDNGMPVYNHVVLAQTAERANEIYRIKYKKEPITSKTERVKNGHYLVAMTYLIDDFS